MATPVFAFKSTAYAADVFSVVDFQGTEAVSSLYRFEIGLKCDVGTAVDLKTLLSAGATLSLEQDGKSNDYSGVLAWAEQRQQAGGSDYYRVLLVPPAWKLSRNVVTAGFVAQTHLAIVQTVLKNGGLVSGDSAVDSTGLSAKYASYDFTCQYAETDLDFVSRLMEREGVYFYFQDQKGVCHMTLADELNYPPNPAAPSIPFTDPSSTNNFDSIVRITRQLDATAGTVTVSGYNYQSTTLSVQGSKPVVVDGQKPTGTYPALWHFDNKVQTPEAASQLANLRAQELACWADTYSGSGAVSSLRAGYTVQLTDHPVAAFNQRYLITGVQHSARNLDQSWTTSTYNAGQAAPAGAYYSNSFTAIPAGVQFRPRRSTLRPHISGLLTGAVWLAPDSDKGDGKTPSLLQLLPAQVNPVPGFLASGSKQNQNAYVPPTPPMDDQGRYLVTLPFANGAVPGASPISAWIRMAQPSAGQWTGTHFMLEPGAEVLLAFVDGNPDLPVIVGSVYNGATQAPLTAAKPNPQI
ncbi:MAG TPA: type VI secretion system tip protein TssI/VgrG [Gammaproteobacteria bacterium]